MMKSRAIPSEISYWMEKDVTLKKQTVGSRLRLDECPENFSINRDFFSQMLNLSSERYRRLMQFDFEKKTFLKHQRMKAETTMPGLRPYVNDPSSPRLSADSFRSSSMQNFSSRPLSRSESTPIPPRELSARQKASMERINRLALPKGHRSHSFSHVRSHRVASSLSPQQLFSHLDVAPSTGKSRSEEKICDDQRFHQLIETCSDVHQRNSTDEARSVESIIQSNSSLQDQEKNKKTTKKKNKRSMVFPLDKFTSIHLMDIGQI